MDVQGTVAAGWEPVRDAFLRNFEQRGERGAAVAVHRDGEKVVDLWAGVKDVDGTEPWTAGTAQVVRSATKGVAAAVPCSCTSAVCWTWTPPSPRTGPSSRPTARTG